MPALHATSRSPPPDPHVIHSSHSTQKVLSTFQQCPPTTTRPLSTPIQLKQLHQEILSRHQNRLTKLGNQGPQQYSFDETENITNLRLPSSEAAQSATLPHTFSSSKRLRKSRSSDRHICGEESKARNRRIVPQNVAGDDADSESDSIDSIYKRLSGPQSPPHPIPECVRALLKSKYLYSTNCNLWI